MLSFLNTTLSICAILAGAPFLARISANRLAALLLITAVPLWLSLGSPTLVMLAFGLAAVERAQQGRWGWAGGLAGLAAITDPSGFVLVAVLGLLALRSPDSLGRYLRGGLPPTLLAAALALLIARETPPLWIAAWLSLLPLIIVGGFGWPYIRTNPFAAAIIAWGALDMLLRVVILGQPLSPVIVPGLALLAASVRPPPLKAAPLLSNAALLAVCLVIQPAAPPPTAALRIPIETGALVSETVSIDYGPDLKLIGVAADQNASAGRTVQLRLEWIVNTAPSAPLTIKIDLLNYGGKPVASTENSVSADLWQPGRVSTNHAIPMPKLPPGVLNIHVSVIYKSVRLGEQVVGRVIVPIGAHPIEAAQIAALGNGGAILSPLLEIHPGSLAVTLRWRSAGALDRDYSYFLHLEDSAGKIITQADAEPLNGNYPTSLWQPGDVISDTAQLDLSKVGSGVFHLRFGMYFGDARLPLRNCGNRTIDSLDLAVITIAPDGAITVERTAPEC